MTVDELIAVLSNLPRDVSVVVTTPGGKHYYDVGDLYTIMDYDDDDVQTGVQVVLRCQ